MNTLLREMLSHMEWADAAMCTFASERESASGDSELRDRTLHILECQNGYLSLMRQAPFVELQRESFPTIRSLIPEVVRYYRGLFDFLREVDTTVLTSELRIPWSGDGRASINIEQGLAQVVMHSQYHRGQNAVRLRRIGYAPPLTDLVMWYLDGKPTAAW